MSSSSPNARSADSRAVSIRPATRRDVALILSLIKELAEYERDPDAAVATPELITRHLFGEGLAAGLPPEITPPARGPLAECVIGEIVGVPQGFALFYHNFSTWVGKPGMYLEDLFVRPAARGSGLGKALFLHVARLAAARGCERFEWSVLDWNTPAIEFYERMGAKPMSEWTVHRVSGPALARLAEA